MKPLRTTPLFSKIEYENPNVSEKDFLESLYKNLKDKIKNNISKTINEFLNNFPDKKKISSICDKNRILVDVNIYFSKIDNQESEQRKNFDEKIDIKKIIIPKFDCSKKKIEKIESKPQSKSRFNRNQILYENYLKKQSCSIFKNANFEQFDPILEEKRLEEKILSSQSKKIKSFWKNKNYTYPYTFKKKKFGKEMKNIVEIYDISNKFIRNDLV